MILAPDTGAVARVLASRLGCGSLVAGLDFSGGMLRRARDPAAGDDRTGVCWVQRDAAALPFQAETFDAVTCAYAPYELKGEARREMLREVARVLVPGGRFLAMEHELPVRRVSRLLFSLRLAVIGAEGARAFLGGEIDELGDVFSGVTKELVPPGKSKILVGTKAAVKAESRETRAERSRGEGVS